MNKIITDKALVFLNTERIKYRNELVILNDMYKDKIYGISKEEIEELENKLTILEELINHFSS